MNHGQSRLNSENVMEGREYCGKTVIRRSVKRRALGDIGNLMVNRSNASKPSKQEKPPLIANATKQGTEEVQVEDEARARKQRRIMQEIDGLDASDKNLPMDQLMRWNDGDSRKMVLFDENRSCEGVVNEELASSFIPSDVDYMADLREDVKHRELDSSSQCSISHDSAVDKQDVVTDPLEVIDYVEDIYDFYRRVERQSCVEEDYLKTRQPDINERMRSVLIDWLIEVHLRFKFMAETLFLAVNVIDRFLACSEAIARKDLQLVGITAMLIASKYQEIWAAEIQDLSFISANAYTKDDILQMEKVMLNKLRFNLSCPTPYVFLIRFLRVASSSATDSSDHHGDHHNTQMMMEMMASLLLELCLTEYSMVSYPPSLLAASAVYAAAASLQIRSRLSSSWSSDLHSRSGYTEERLRECAMKMASFHKKAMISISDGDGDGDGEDDGERRRFLRAVRSKYSQHPSFHVVADLDLCASIFSSAMPAEGNPKP